MSSREFAVSQYGQKRVDATEKMLRDPDTWPLGGYLPLKRRTGDSLELASYTRSGTLSIDFSDGSSRKMSVDEIIAEGWVVD